MTRLRLLPAVHAGLLLASFVLAGCAEPKDPDDPLRSAGIGKDDPQAGAVEIPLPSWAVGDHWTYTFNGEPTTYVITSESATDWTMETDSPERAFSNLRDDISRLGPQRKSDLAGSQGDDRVQFFQWPLVTGMPDWTTRWDQQDVVIHVVGANLGFTELEARLANATAAEPPLYRYVYDDTVGWFRQLIHYAPDGSERVRLELTSSGHNWTGTIARWDLKSLFEDAGDVTLRTVQVDAGATDLWLAFEAHCSGGAGGYTLAIGPADASASSGTYTASEQCTDKSLAEPIVEAPKEGQWVVSWNAGGQPGLSAFSVELLQRTRVDAPFG